MVNPRHLDQSVEENALNKSTELSAHDFIDSRSTLSNEEKKFLRLVEQEQGQIIQLRPSTDIFKSFLPTLNEIKEIVTGSTIRPGGLTVYPTSQVQSSEVISELMSTIEIDRNPSGVRYTLFRTAKDQFQLWEPNSKLYHSTLMLDYLFTRYVGWVDPMDLDWLLKEKAQVDLRGGDADYGFSLSKSLSESLMYGQPGRLGSFLEVLHGYLGKPLPKSLEIIKNNSIVLEIDVNGLRASFPEGKVFWKGIDPHEYCCPMIPPELPEIGLNPLAIIEWPLPSEKNKAAEG